MEYMCNPPINCDIKTFNEIWCGTLNPACDSHYEPETKPDWIDEENRFFSTHVKEAIQIFREVFKKR